MEGPLQQQLPNVQDLNCIPFFCEENIWKLCKRLINSGIDGQCVQVVIISNATKQVPLWKQKNASNRDYVVWDYHVVLSLTFDEKKLVYDLNSTLPQPCPANQYWMETLNLDIALPSELKRNIRIVDGEYYLTHFSSDRRHMKNSDGHFIVSPPPWPILFQPDRGHNLGDFIDMKNRQLATVTTVYSEDDFQQEPVRNFFGFN